MLPTPSDDAPLVIDICLGTYLRPVGLRLVLEAIAAQQFDRITRPDLVVVVVDNDPEGSARTVAEDTAASTGLRVNYSVEPRRGIPVVRNATVAATRPEATFIAFLDDDEQPAEDWLEQLVLAQRTRGADAVCGPVIPVFESGVPGWIERGGFHDRERFATGARLPFAATNNVLVRAPLLRRSAEPFDVRLALSSGEDTLFFWQLTRDGNTIEWCDEAVVHETIPRSRATVMWLIRRAYRGGNTFTVCERIFFEGRRPVRRVLNRAARGVLRIVRGVVRILVSPVLGQRVGAMNGVRMLVNGVGVLTALLGFGFEEYVKTHGE